MKSGSFDFRFRMVFMALIIGIGFSTPWVELWDIGSRITLLEWLALELSRLGLLSFTVATPVVIVCGALVAALGAWLRIWGSAWLGHGVVINQNMQGAELMADGPFRYVRNPLYIGMYLWVAALCLMMPAAGALFVLIAVPVLIGFLISGEESFLSARLGAPYQAYLRAVPRLFPRVRTTLGRSGNRPHWGQAVASEINPIGVFIAIAGFSWSYNHWLMVKVVIVTFGLSLVVRAVMPGLRPGADSPKSPAN